MADLLIGQATTALAAGLAVTILLLLLGTQILNWYWVALVCAGSFCLGAYRTLRRVPSPYRFAQSVDRRLSLEDYLSTAYYFSGPEPDRHGSEALRELVCGQAARMCREIRPEAAAPIRFPRSAYAAAALAAAAAALFSVRYFTTRSLDLRSPLAPAIADLFRPSWLPGGPRKEVARREPGLPPQAGLVIDPARADEEGVRAPASEESRQAGQQGDQYSQEAASLLDKMRDAFRDMLEELGLSKEAREAAESTSGEGQPGGKDAKENGEKGEPSEMSAEGSGKARADQEGEEAAGGDERSMEARQRDGKSDSPDGKEDGQGSGIGTADGDKAIRDAEQEAAMGKLSEILGQRQANLTGEMMVEVTSTKQQKLTTPYAPSDAAHAEGGGQVHRDEVPLMYRDYVQQYFERVRKEASAPPPGKH